MSNRTAYPTLSRFHQNVISRLQKQVTAHILLAQIYRALTYHFTGPISNLILPDLMQLQLETPPLIEDKGQTDRVTTPTRARLRHATLHASPSQRDADGTTIKITITALSQHLTLTLTRGVYGGGGTGRNLRPIGPREENIPPHQG